MKKGVETVLNHLFFLQRLQAVPEAAAVQNAAMPSISPIFKCPKCNRHHMTIRAKKDNNGFFFTCLGRPECSHAIWLADVIKEIKVHEQDCNRCQQNGNKKIAIKFKSNNLLGMLNASLIDDNDRTYVSCLLCDHSLRVVLDVNQTSLRGNAAVNQNRTFNRTAPIQNAARPTNAPSQTSRPINNRPPPTLPNPNPNPNANQSFRNAGNVRCSICNQPAIK